MKKEKMLILGFLICLLREYHRGTGSKTIDLCFDIINNENNSFGMDYQGIHQTFSKYSMATIHKVFSVLIGKKVVKKNKDGVFYFDEEGTLQMIDKGNGFE